MTDVLETLASHPACDVLRMADIDDFLASNPRALLFLSGDVRARPEEAALMARFGVVVTPAVAYMRDGQPAELVARMRDWPVFAQAAERLLAPAGEGPATGIGGNA